MLAVTGSPGTENGFSSKTRGLVLIACHFTLFLSSLSFKELFTPLLRMFLYLLHTLKGTETVHLETHLELHPLKHSGYWCVFQCL